MKFSLALTALILPILVNAQSSANASTTSGSSSSTANATTTSGSSTSSSASPSATASTVSVVVAPNNTLAFSVENIVAANGTQVVFTWSNTTSNHSVTQSSFEAPCTPLSSGFSSGLLKNGQFTLTVVDDTTPVYLFCAVGQHCSSGMVAAINAPANGTGSASAFLAAARAVSNQTAVSNTTAQTGGVGGVVASSTPSGTAASSAVSPSSTSDAGRLVASGVFVLLATVLGMTLA